jgi:predicted nucleotidyltransferase
MGVSERVHEKRDQILEIAARHGAHNVRVFGSTAKGEAGPESDKELEDE